VLLFLVNWAPADEEAIDLLAMVPSGREEEPAATSYSCLLQPPTVVVGSRVGRTRQQGWRSQRWEQGGGGASGGGSGRSKLEEEEATGAGCRPATSVAVWWAQEKG